jgi:ribosomal protein L37AE/L43A
MSVDMYRDRGVMTTTKSLVKRKTCEGCGEKVAIIVRKADKKWYCNDCAGADGGLIVMDEDGHA